MYHDGDCAERGKQAASALRTVTTSNMLDPTRLAYLGFNIFRANVWGLGFGVWGFGFMVQSSGFRVPGFGYTTMVTVRSAEAASAYMAPGPCGRAQRLGFEVWSLGFRG